MSLRTNANALEAATLPLIDLPHESDADAVVEIVCAAPGDRDTVALLQRCAEIVTVIDPAVEPNRALRATVAEMLDALRRGRRERYRLYLDGNPEREEGLVHAYLRLWDHGLVLRLGRFTAPRPSGPAPVAVALCTARDEPAIRLRLDPAALLLAPAPGRGARSRQGSVMPSRPVVTPARRRG